MRAEPEKRDRPLALITGAGRARGIAAGIARKLAADGWDLSLNYWQAYDERMSWGADAGAEPAWMEELAESGASVLPLPGDLSLPETAGEIFRALREGGRPVSALVMAHCESVDSDLLSTTVESFDRHYAVNVRASWQLVREFALQVPASGGRIAALTSDALVGNVPYGATKAALDRVVLACTRELAGRGIVANVINPGPIDTGWMDIETRRLCLQRQPSGRLGTPEDTANLVSFLLSPEGGWINGQLLKSDGGCSA